MRNHMRLLAVCLFFSTTVLVACQGKSNEPQPPEIVYGQDVCDQCGMIIGEGRFAAATLLTDGEALIFDEIGDMLVYQMDHPEAQVKAWFVHDYPSEAWMRGETAYFVKSESLKTPMGGGIVAFEKKEVAEAFATEWDGKVYTLDELRAQVHIEVHGD